MFQLGNDLLNIAGNPAQTMLYGNCFLIHQPKTMITAVKSLIWGNIFLP